ncbi:MAG: S41 family peptidase [Geminicoccaceae bacterium]
MTVVKALAVTGFFLNLAAAPVSVAGPAYERVVDAARASAVIADDIIEAVKSSCQTALCFAEALAAERPDHVRLEPVDHPDTDSIRWVSTRPSVIVEETPGKLRLEFTHFGRKALPELRAALASAKDAQSIAIDVSGNAGGDFERMLSIAGLLLGSVRDAVEIDHGDHIERHALQGCATGKWQVASVETDNKTASAALLLARLLAVHGGAELIGPPFEEKPIFLKRRIPIDHDWRLVLPVAVVKIAEP